MAQPKTIASIVEAAENAKNAKEAAAILKANSSAALKAVVGYALDPAVTWMIPSGTPPYKPLPKAADQEMRLYAEYRKLIYLVDSAESKNLTKIKREQLFVQLLESLDPDDAALLIRVRNRQINIPVKAVKEAFPGISKDWP